MFLLFIVYHGVWNDDAGGVRTFMVLLAQYATSVICVASNGVELREKWSCGNLGAVHCVESVG